MCFINSDLAKMSLILIQSDSQISKLGHNIYLLSMKISSHAIFGTLETT